MGTCCDNIIPVQKKGGKRLCMEERKLKVIFGKDGRGSTNTKITLPITILRDMGVTPENREVTLQYNENQKIITIKK